MQTELVLAFAIVFTLDSISPGPAVAAVVAKSATVGLRRTLLFICGLILGDILLFSFAIAGLAALAAAMGPFFGVIKWIGVCYLLYLAYKTWTADPVEVSKEALESKGVKDLVLGTLLPLGTQKQLDFILPSCLP